MLVKLLTLAGLIAIMLAMGADTANSQARASQRQQAGILSPKE